MSDYGDFCREQRKLKSDKSHKNRMAFDPTGWTEHSETHYSRTLCGHRLDYWPGTRRWRYRGRTQSGNVLKFIDQTLANNAVNSSQSANRWSK